MQIPFYVKWIMKLAGALYPKHILPKLLNLFVPLDKDKQPKGPQQFQDNWYKCLPMDNRVNDILMPVEKSAEVMRSLRDYFKKTGYPASGSFSTEIYAAKKSDFWLSPSYNQDVIRVDIFWFKYNEGNPATDFYPQFWNLLMQNKDLSCRFHWGKYMPVNPDYVKSQYPKMNDFLTLRSKLDPSNIFLTKYWKDRLGI